MNDLSATGGNIEDRAKQAAGRFAVQAYCFDGARVGLGSGSTSHYLVRALADRVHDGLQITGVATSTATRDLAIALGITTVELDGIDQLDICLDGCDEIDPDGTMIKGGGACLLWEKLVAVSSARMVVIADSSKAVATLGVFPLPVEIVKFAHGTTTNAIRRLLVHHGYAADVKINRREREGHPVITDNGNYLVDVQLDRIADSAALTADLNQIPAVVENGLFVGMAEEVVFGWSDGTAATYRFPLTIPLRPPAP